MVADPTYSTLNYEKQGGAEWVIGGLLTIAPGGAINAAAKATAAGANVDGAVFDVATEVALGSYANAMNAKLDFGAAGSVTGLGGALCLELDLGPGTTSGTYAVFEGELNVPAGAKTGTATSFFALNVWGADASTFDTNGTLFSIAGVTKAGGKFLQDTTSGATVRPVQVIKVITPDGIRYLPLYSTAAISA